MHKINAFKVKKHMVFSIDAEKEPFTKSNVFYDKIPRHGRTRRNIVQNIKVLYISQTHNQLYTK